MTNNKKSQKVEKNPKKTAAAIGKPGRKSAKSTEKLVKGLTHSAEEVLAKTGNKLKPTQEGQGSDQEKVSSRFKGVGQKTVAEAISILAGEIRTCMEEHEEIGASKLLSLMKGRGYSDAMVFAAMGWLLRDKKIVISNDGKKISLK